MILKFENKKYKNHLIKYNLLGGFLMDKKTLFKEFVSKHPELVTYIKNKENTWQDFYEIYDIYGEDESAWNKYFNNESATKEASLGELTNLFNPRIN